MSNSKIKKKNLIDAVGVREPLSAFSSEEAQKDNAKNTNKVSHSSSEEASISASLKESDRVAIGREVVGEAEPEPEGVAAPEAANKVVSSDSLVTETEKIPSSDSTSAPAVLKETSNAKVFPTVSEEDAAMPEWEKNELKKVTFDEKLVQDNVILSVRHLKKFFTLGTGLNKTKLKAVHDVSFDIKKGEVFGLVGESGCGKTTTGRTIIRLHMPTSGSVYFNGYRISAGNRWNEKEIKWTKKRGHQRISELKSTEKEIISDMSNTSDEDKEKVAQIKAEYKAKIAAIRKNINEVTKVQKAKIKQHNYDNRHIDKHLLTKIQMIFQDPIDSLDPRMTVEDIIEEGLKIQHFGRVESGKLKKQWDADLVKVESDKTLSASEKEDAKRRLAKEYEAKIADARNYRKKVGEVLTKVGLLPDYANRYPHEFSGGQRQRIGIARALVMNPELIIADEPISALDVSIRAQIINLLNDLKDEMGLTIIFIAHDLSVVKYFCERIAVMYYGSLVELASSDELFRHPLHPYTKSLLSAIPRPDPLLEQKRTRIRYNPATAHDYSKQKPTLREIIPGHWVLANDAEIAKYKVEMKQEDASNAKKAAFEAEISKEVKSDEKAGKFNSK